MKDLKASASFILRKTRGVIFHLNFKGSKKTKDESLKASASFILKKGPESHLFILKEAESLKMKVLKRQRLSL